jgi:hypothetical protein
MIWLTLLPFSLYSSCGVGIIPLCFIMAFLLLGGFPRGPAGGGVAYPRVSCFQAWPGSGTPCSRAPAGSP